VRLTRINVGHYTIGYYIIGYYIIGFILLVVMTLSDVTPFLRAASR